MPMWHTQRMSDEQPTDPRPNSSVNALGLTLADRIYEMRQRLMSLLLERDWTTDHLDGAMDRFFWLPSDLNAFRRSKYSPATLTLNGLDRLAQVLEVPMHTFLRDLDKDDRPLPVTLLGPLQKWDISTHIGRSIRGRRERLGRTAGWVCRNMPGWTSSDLKRLERGEFEPSVIDLMMIGDRIGYTFADFIGDLTEGAEDDSIVSEHPPIALGEEAQDDLLIRLWYRPGLGDDPNAWTLMIMRSTGSGLFMPAQDELTEAEWRSVLKLADRVVERARQRLSHLDIPEVRFRKDD